MIASRRLALALTSVFAVGCAAARAQDGQDAPPPEPRQPLNEAARQGPNLREAPAPLFHEQRIRDAERRIAEATQRLEEVKRGGHGPDAPEMARALRDLEDARAWMERTRAEIAKMHAEREAVLAQRARAQHIIEHNVAPSPQDLHGPDWRPHPERQREPMSRGGPMQGPGGDVERRLAMLERAVREMHEMFQRHNVPPEARERAEREMRERADGGPPPGERPPEGQPLRPERGERPGFEAGKPPRPPSPRPEGMGPGTHGAGPGSGMPNMDEVRRRMEEAHAQIQALQTQLAEAQTALTKAQEQLEELRAKK